MKQHLKSLLVPRVVACFLPLLTDNFFVQVSLSAGFGLLYSYDMGSISTVHDFYYYSLMWLSSFLNSDAVD